MERATLHKILPFSLSFSIFLSMVPMPNHVNVIEHCHISSPRKSAPPTSLPLTFFDIPWLLFSPSQTFFFYKFPNSTPHFTTTTLPILKHSLSLTLQHFHPLAGNLSIPPQPSKPHIIYGKGDSVSLTIADSNADFNRLSSNHPRNVTEFHLLLPRLSSPTYSSRATHVVPLMAVQITTFPDSGMCIGLAMQHVVADERTFNNFIKSWALISNSLLKGEPLVSIKSIPWYDRSSIIDSNMLEATLLKQWWKQRNTHITKVVPADMARATFVLSPSDMDKIKSMIIARCNEINQSPPLVLSPYVMACSFVWVCLIKAQTWETDVKKEPIYFGFNAGGTTRLGYEVPGTYFGNCIAFGRSEAMANELVAEDGVVLAAKAIARTIKELDKEVLGGGKRWICDWEVFFGENELNVMVVGSPKVDLYETDFGLGRPNKIEKMTSIDGNGKAIFLTESRELKGGIEVGLVLPMAKMETFTRLFNDGLKAIS